MEKTGHSRLHLSINKIKHQRDQLRRTGKFSQADGLRLKLAKLGYEVIDSADSSTVFKKTVPRRKTTGPGLLAIFGSGEISSSGRIVHERLVQPYPTGVRIGLLTTPSGYEDNPDHWYLKLCDRLQSSLSNYKPQIRLIQAYRRDGQNSTNSQEIVKSLGSYDYIHTGAGSPSYALTHLRNSLVWRKILELHSTGTSISFASAGAIASGRFALPVYELYFAGHDPFWVSGLDFFRSWGLNLTFIPHWNNTEGGKDIDTRYAYMGQRRFNKLLDILPMQTSVVGIDEHTSLVFDFIKQSVQILGVGSVTVMFKNRMTVKKSGETIAFNELRGSVQE